MMFLKIGCEYSNSPAMQMQTLQWTRNECVCKKTEQTCPDACPCPHLMSVQPERRQAEDPQRMAVSPGPRNHPAALPRHRGGQAAFLQTVRRLCFRVSVLHWCPPEVWLWMFTAKSADYVSESRQRRCKHTLMFLWGNDFLRAAK